MLKGQRGSEGTGGILFNLRPELIDLHSGAGAGRLGRVKLLARCSQIRLRLPYAICRSAFLLLRIELLLGAGLCGAGLGSRLLSPVPLDDRLLVRRPLWSIG